MERNSGTISTLQNHRPTFLHLLAQLQNHRPTFLHLLAQLQNHRPTFLHSPVHLNHIPLWQISYRTIGRPSSIYWLSYRTIGRPSSIYWLNYRTIGQSSYIHRLILNHLSVWQISYCCCRKISLKDIKMVSKTVLETEILRIEITPLLLVTSCWSDRQSNGFLAYVSISASTRQGYLLWARDFLPYGICKKLCIELLMIRFYVHVCLLLSNQLPMIDCYTVN